MRQQAGLTMREAASRVGWNATGISTVESGDRNPHAEDVASLLTVYGVVDQRRTRLVEMVKSPVDKPCWWEATTPELHPEISLSIQESSAMRVTEWSPALVPALLQTSDYTRALSTLDRMSPEETEALLAGRIERIRVLKQVPYVGFISEEALCVPLGGPIVHRRQLQHLADMSRWGLVRVVRRLVPHAGLHGAWTALHYSDGVVVRVDLLDSRVYLTGSAAQPYRAAQARLIDVALSPGHSHALIASMVHQPTLMG